LQFKADRTRRFSGTDNGINSTTGTSFKRGFHEGGFDQGHGWKGLEKGGGLIPPEG